jgi:hypothetical protein
MVGTGEPVTAHLNSTNCCSCTSWNRGLIVAWGGCVTEPASDTNSEQNVLLSIFFSEGYLYFPAEIVEMLAKFTSYNIFK